MKEFFARLLRLLFSRWSKADDLSLYPNWRVGLSSAASWSWGVSLAVGMSIMYTKGLLPFIIWTTGNILAIPLFGVIRTYFPLSRHWPRFIFPMVILFLFVEFFCIVLNLQGILTGFGGNVKGIVSYSFLSPATAKYAVMAIGLFVVWYIHKGGLRMSVLTDYGQYAIQLLGTILLATLGYFIGGHHDITWVINDPKTGLSGLEWAKFGFFGIIVGAMGTSHHWQRFHAIKEENILKVSLWGGLWFGVYMFFVGLTGLFFSSNIVLGTIFVIIMIALGTSSIDSAIAGIEYDAVQLGFKKIDLHYPWIARKEKTFTIYPYKIATLVSVIAVLFWPYFAGGSMADLWTFMAAQRLKIVGIFIVSTVLITCIRWLKNNTHSSFVITAITAIIIFLWQYFTVSIWPWPIALGLKTITMFIGATVLVTLIKRLKTN